MLDLKQIPAGAGSGSGSGSGCGSGSDQLQFDSALKQTRFD